MNKEEIDYWLRLFSNNNQCFMSKDGKKITLFKVFQELKELQRLSKIKNDYINELEQENQELKKELEEKNNSQMFIDTQDMEERYAEGLYQDYLEEENKKYKNQQKEFIEWLTNETNINPYDISDYTYEDIINTILSKYNEIIGSDSK